MAKACGEFVEGMGKADPMGRDRLAKKDQGRPLASPNTLNRMELTPAEAGAESRYRKVV